MRAGTSIAVGGVMLLWPAFYNGWPFVFTDTGAFMFAALERWPQWDKPIAYALVLHVLSWRVTYWTAILVQALAVSQLCWLMLRSFARATPALHLPLMLGVAALTAAPWFASHLMPDVLAPILVLAVVLLALAGDRLTRGERAWLAFLAALSAASHLSHLGVLLGLLACLVPVRLLCRLSALPRPGVLALGAAPIAAIGFLLASNAVMWGQTVISPFGSVFPLARQLANGPAMDFLRAYCPGFHLCAQLNRIGTDSDRILWDADSPLWAEGDERVMAPEASAILAGTLRAYPLAVAQNALRDTLRQLVLVRVGDSLIPDDLDKTVLNNLQRHLPREVGPFLAAREINGRLDILPAANVVILATIGASILVLPPLLMRRRDRRYCAAVLLVLLALLGNAAICGATSTPHHRYQARIAWLLPLIAGLGLAMRTPPCVARASAA